MKIKFFALMAIFSISCSANDYKNIRENFKSSLYSRQIGLMERDKYKTFIEPYLKKAETTLQIPKYLMGTPNNELCQEYFNCLLNYNVAIFHNYVKPNSEYFYNNLIRTGSDLRNIINEINTKAQLGLNANNEFNMTGQILREANKAYYKQLGLFYKFIFYARL